MTEDGSDRAGVALHRQAQNAAGELARMGIDPTAVGLPPSRHDGDVPTRIRGVAPFPAATPVSPAQSATAQPMFGGLPTRPDPAPPPTPPPAPAPVPPAEPPPAYGTMVSRPMNPAALAGTDGTYRMVREIAATPDRGGTVPSGWRRVARAASLGLIGLDGAAAAHRERALLADLQTRQHRPRSVAFLSSKGGVGVTTTAAGVALTLAAIRRDRTVLVDVRTGTDSLGRRLVGRPAPSITELSGPGAEAPLAAGAYLSIVDGATWHAPVGRGELLNLLADLRDSHPFTILDGGNDSGDATHAAVGRADQIVLVTSASADAVDATRLALGRIYQTHPMSLERLVIAVVCLSPRSYRRTARALRSSLGTQRASLVPVPYDRRLARGGRIELDAVQPATRESYLAIAASIANPPRNHPATAIRRQP